MSEWVGRTLSKVEIQQLLGRGGMADVYLGRHTTLNRPVAVKILHAHLSNDETLQGRFRGEAQAVATMRHPNIVQVFDFDVVDDRPYIVMELLEGISLKDYLAHQRKMGRRLAPETVATLIAALAEALDYAHARGVIHRDVKPANVMLRHEHGSIDPNEPLPAGTQPILTDFGVARMADASVQTASGVIIGTPAYMSPEQVRGEGVDSRSDIYSLGIMLYEMLAGVLPFDGDTQASILIKHISEPPPPLPDGSPELQAVVDRALAKDPAMRFQRASDLAASLLAALRLSAGMITEPHFVEAASVPVEPQATRNLHLQTGLGAATPPAGTTTTQVVTQAGPAVWIVGAIGALALIVSLVALLGMFNQEPADEVTVGARGGAAESAATLSQDSSASTATFSSVDESVVLPTQDPTISHGTVQFRDSSVTVTLTDVPSLPDGYVYEAWLTEPEGDLLSLGIVELANERVEVEFTDPDGAILITQYSGFALSLEPANDPDPQTPDTLIYVGEVLPETVARARLLFSKTRESTLQAAVLGSLGREANTYDSHRQLAIDALVANNLSGGKQHAEHTINLLVGEQSPDFADWDGNGRIENPGDGVGVINYLLLLDEAIAGATGVPEPAIDSQINELLLVAADAEDAAKRISASDTVEEARSHIEALSALPLGEAVAGLLGQAQGLDMAIRAEVFPVPP